MAYWKPGHRRLLRDVSTWGLGISEPADFTTFLTACARRRGQESWDCSPRERGGSGDLIWSAAAPQTSLAASPVCPCVSRAKELQNGCQGSGNILLLGAWLDQVADPIQGLLLYCRARLWGKPGTGACPSLPWELPFGSPCLSCTAAMPVGLAVLGMPCPSLRHCMLPHPASALPARLWRAGLKYSPPSTGYSLPRCGVPACLNCLWGSAG